jgi:hypothetical protein
MTDEPAVATSGRVKTWSGALAILATLCVLPPCLPAQTPNPLDDIAFLAGGTWQGGGRWPDSTVMRVDVRYFWGPTRRVLHFETYDLETGERRLLYEGWILFDRTRGKLVQWNVKPTGETDVSEYDHVDSTGFEVVSTNTRSSVRRTGPDMFRWELRVPKDGAWTVILNATYRHVPASAGRPEPFAVRRLRGTD